MAARVGPRPHARHDRGPAGLVHLPPAILGRADDRFLLRGLRQAARGFPRAAPRAALFRARRRGRLVHAHGRRTSSARHEVRVRRVAKWRKENDILDVWFDSGSTHLAVLTEANGLHWPARCLPRRPRPIPRMVPKLAARRRRARAAARLTSKSSRTAGRSTKTASRCRSRAATRFTPSEICEKWGADLLRLWVVSQDYTADMRNSPAMMTQLCRSLSQNSQYVSLRALEPFRFRSRARRARRRRPLGNGRLDAAPHRRSSSASASSGTRISNFIASTTRCTISAPSI